MLPIKSKKIFDSVHGFIYLDSLESEFIQTKPFQRLHHIHQLGVAYLVYPGGTHRRYEHSLGVMALATEMYDHLIVSTYDLSMIGQFDPLLFTEVPQFLSPEYEYWRRIIRFAALCHDMGHLPFSHSAEKLLLGDGGHEKWTIKLIQSPTLRPFWNQLSEKSGPLMKSPEDVELDVLKTAVGESDLKEMGFKIKYSPWEKIVSEIITADFFGADRIDYLLRDAKYTGITYGLFDYHQLIEMLRILPIVHQDHIHLALGIEEEGIESCEALLMSRYFMHKRICHYATVKAYTWHLKNFMHVSYSNSHFFKSLDNYIDFSEHEVFSEMAKAEKDPQHAGHHEAICFSHPEKRCKAIALPSPIDQEVVQKLLADYGLNEESIALEINSLEVDFNTGLDFPVHKKNGQICLCRSLSKVTIPNPSSNWLYVPSVHEKAIRQQLAS